MMARAAIEAGLTILDSLPGSLVARFGPLLTLGIRAEADLASIAQAGRDGTGLRRSQEIAGSFLARLQATAEDVRLNQPAYVRITDAYLSGAHAEMTRLEGRSDPRHWSTSASKWMELSMPYDEAYARFRQAEAVLQGHGARATALESIRRARQLARDLGAAPLLQEVEGLASRSRLELDDEETPAGPMPVVDSPTRYGLTPREREVLDLLAAGDTNRQIAERLFISEKTASVHVSNILRKLSVTSRTEAAGLAYRLHLVAAQPIES